MDKFTSHLNQDRGLDPLSPIVLVQILGPLLVPVPLIVNSPDINSKHGNNTDNIDAH